eukprot:tig00020904_g15262.t1
MRPDPDRFHLRINVERIDDFDSDVEPDEPAEQLADATSCGVHSAVEHTLNTLGCVRAAGRLFTVIYNDGGQFSSDYLVENLLRTRGVYCSEKQGDINIVLRFEHPQSAPFTLTSLMVVAPVVGFTSPVGTGLIFVSWDKPDLEACRRWDGCTRERFEAHRAACDRHGRTPSESDPAAFFELGRSSSRCVELSPPRSGRFVLIKLLRAKPGSKGTNVDCEYVGLRGFCGAQGFPCGELR